MHEPVFDSNIAIVDVLFARIWGVASCCSWSNRKNKPLGLRRTSRVAALTLPNSFSSNHGWMICKISIAIESWCFETEKKPKLRYAMRMLWNVLPCHWIPVWLSVFLGLSWSEGSPLARLARGSDTSLSLTHYINANSPSIHRPVSNDITSVFSVLLCDTAVCFLFAHEIGTNVWPPNLHRATHLMLTLNLTRLQ